MKNSIELENRFVAFIDILGFREIVASMSNDPGTVVFIRDVLKTVQKQERRISRERRSLQGASFLPPSRIEMTAFSDCYVISDKIDSGWQVLVAVQALAALMLYRGV